MKHLLTIFLISLALAGFGQTQISTSQIRDGAVTSPKLGNGAVTKDKLATDAISPVSSGALTDYALNFVVPYGEVFTLDVDEDVPLTLAGSGNVNNTWIIINATGDGTHVLTWPASWRITGTYDPNAVQEIFLRFNGSNVIGEITQFGDAIEATLSIASISTASPTQLNLTFSQEVNIDITGWSVTASGGTVTILSVTETGVSSTIFLLSRQILHTETVTISYAPAAGQTTNLSGNEIEQIVNQAVIPPDAPAPPATQDCDFTVCATGGTHTTIQAATDAASSGDIICICAGTYRETIVAKSGVTYTNVTGDEAIISGFELVGTSGWTVHSGNIYKKTITLPVNGFNTSTTQVIYPGNTTIYANQIIRDDVMMHEAREPDIAVGTADLFNRAKYKEGVDYTNGFNQTQLTDAALPNSASVNLTGGTIVANGWFMQEPRTITSHSGTTINYSAIWGTSGTSNWARKRWYVTGKLGLLDVAGEWHYESGTLYFFQPGGGTPTGVIEYKARNWGFDGRGKNNVQIIGLKFEGCEPFVGDASSTNTLLDGIESTYQNHHVRHDVWEWQGVGMSKQFGIKLLGANSTIKNSHLHDGGSSGVWLGPNCRAENNLMHDIGYVGYWANAISLWGTDGGQTITRNTIYRTGRSSFDFGYNFGNPPGTSQHLNVEFSYNDCSQWGLISSDVGATYTWGQCVLTGLNYHHNWLWNGGAPDRSDVGLTVAIYFDQATGPGKIHHNVTWLTGAADIYHETINETRAPNISGWGANGNPALDIYNNTFAHVGGSAAHDNTPPFPRSYITYRPSPFDRQRNNIYRSQIITTSGNDISNSVLNNVNPLFSGTDLTAQKGLYFQLQSGSPARNVGVASFAGLTGAITDGHVDAGAYPFGGEAWVPGYVEPVDDGSVNDTEATFSGTWFYYSGLSWTQKFKNNDVNVTYEVGANATYAFHGTQVAVRAEECDNHNTALIEVFESDGTTLIEDEIVNLYANTGGTPADVCPGGTVETVFTSAVMAEDDYVVKVTFDAADNAQVPARNTLVFDGFIITP